MQHTAKAYKLTTYSCFTGIFVQAIVTNITAILFIPLMKLYGLSYVHLGILVGINFTAQVASDIIFSRLIDKYGFKRFVLAANICAFLGLLLFALTPYIFNDVLVGIAIATVIFSAASGLLEVLLSPIINSIPNEDKGPAMALMHSFYAWGQVATIIITTLFLYLFGSSNWKIIVAIWAIIPVVNFFMFIFALFPKAIPDEHRLNMRDLIFKPFYIVALLAIFFGAATEIVMNQWASTFMEKALLLPKLTGDILGMCGFAIMLGLGRVLYGIYGAKFNMNKVLVYSSGVAIISYITVAVSPVNAINLIACALCGLVASLLWPGTLVITAEKYPLAGAWMFAILAAAGDIGAAFSSWITGVIAEKSMNMHALTDVAAKFGISSEQIGIRMGILAAMIFPILAMVCHYVLKRRQNA
jgi:MFS family permease